MPRELTPTAPGPDLAHQLQITPDQQAAIRRLIARQPTAHHDDLLAMLGLDAPADQPTDAH